MNGFDFDLQRFAPISIGGTSEAGNTTSGKATISATGGQAWVESVSGGFNFGSTEDDLDGSVKIVNDSTWGATLSVASDSGVALTAIDGVTGLGANSTVQITASMEDGSIKTDAAGAFAFDFDGNASNFTVTGDKSVTFNVADSAIEGVSGLDMGASLSAASGTYIVNGTEVAITTSSGIIVGDSDGAHLYNAASEGGDSVTPEDIAEGLGVNTSTLNSGDVDYSATDGTITVPADEAAYVQISSGTGVASTISLTLSSVGGSYVGIASNTSKPVDLTTGGGGDYIGIAATSAKIDITSDGDDTVSSAGKNVQVDASKSGDGARFSVLGNGKLYLSGLNPLKSRASVVTGFDNLLTALKQGLVKLVNSSLEVHRGEAVGTISFGSRSSSSDLASSGDLIASADTAAVNSHFQVIDDVLTGWTDSAGGVLSASDYGNLSDENILLQGNYDNTKTGGSTLTGGDGADTIMGGAGDILNGGGGNNQIELYTSNALSATRVSGATVVLSSENKATDTISGFNAGFDKYNDVIAIDLSNSSSSFDFDGSGNLVVSTGSETAVFTNANGINSGNVNELLVDNGTGELTQLAVAGNGVTIDAASTDATAYAGKSAYLDLSNVSGSAAVMLNEGGAATVGSNTSALVSGMGTIKGAAGVTSIYGSSADETFVAGGGETSLWGGAGRDLLVGSTLSADQKNGSTTFGFLAGDGKDTIQNFVGLNESSDVADKLYVQEGLTNVSASGNDVVVKLNSSDILTMENAVGKDIDVVYEGEHYVGQVGTNAVTVNGAAGYYYTSSNNASVVASSDTGSVNIWLDSSVSFRTDDAVYEGDIRTLSAKNASGNATLAGNSNDNSIIGGSYSNSLWGGQSTSDDTLGAGASGSKNTFFYGVNSLNEGNDVISGAGANDTVRILSLSVSDFTNGAASISQATSSAVAVDFTDGGSLTINNINAGTTFALGDGTQWTYNKRSNTFQQKG